MTEKAAKTGTLITIHPVDGVLTQSNMVVHSALTQAEMFAAYLYPNVEVGDRWMSGNWWITGAEEVKDLTRLTPKPWPIAGFIPDANMAATFGGQAPAWLAMVAQNSNLFSNFSFETKDALATFLRMLTFSGCEVTENETHGFKVTWKQTSKSAPIVVAYGFQFSP